MATRRNKKKRTYKKVISIVLICSAIVLFSTVLSRLAETFALQKQVEEMERQLQLIKDENASLTSTKEKLEDPDYIQTYARGEYMFSKGDEKVFYLPGD